MRPAVDPIGFIVLAIIIFNVVSSLIAGAKRAAARAAAKSADAQSQQRSSQALTQRPAPSVAATARAAELQRLRRALLASAGTPDPGAVAVQTAVYTATTQPLAPRVPAASAIARAPSTRIASSMPAQQSMPASPSLLVAPAPDTWSLRTGGTLMTLESGTTAFDQLALPGSRAAAAQANAADAAARLPTLSLLQGSSGAASLFIAAAIAGPCAAFRPSGHTPGGW